VADERARGADLKRGGGDDDRRDEPGGFLLVHIAEDEALAQVAFHEIAGRPVGGWYWDSVGDAAFLGHADSRGLRSLGAADASAGRPTHGPVGSRARTGGVPSRTARRRVRARGGRHTGGSRSTAALDRRDQRACADRDGP